MGIVIKFGRLFEHDRCYSKNDKIRNMYFFYIEFIDFYKALENQY